MLLPVTDKNKERPMPVIQGETLRLKHSLNLSQKKLMQFESKYKISSEKFITDWAAEDLPGKDMEYIEWAGEIELAERLRERISALESITT
jgi:hypothetical protein